MRKTLLLLLLLAACAPQLVGVDPARPPDPTDWSPRPAPLEWWYVAGYLPEEGLAIQWAAFKAYTPPELPLAFVAPGPYFAMHLAVTDLEANRFVFNERADYPWGYAKVQAKPLSIELEGWRFAEEGGRFVLKADALEVVLTPEKPPVVHPPGYSGTAQSGRMYYTSYTRVRLEGRWGARPIAGTVWMDHQWGTQRPGARVTWDWFGLHLSDGSEVMIYRVKDAAGRVVQLAGSRVDVNGTVRALEDLEMHPLTRWTSPSGRTYAVGWRVFAEGLTLVLRPERLEQEILSRTTRVAYWEGPVVGEGRWNDAEVRAWGMGEFVAGPYDPAVE